MGAPWLPDAFAVCGDGCFAALLAVVAAEVGAVVLAPALIAKGLWRVFA